MGVCNCSMFCCTLLYVHSSIAIILMGKRELIALLNLSSWCLVMVERLFLAVLRGSLQFVILVFPDHTHLLSLMSIHVQIQRGTGSGLPENHKNKEFLSHIGPDPLKNHKATKPAFNVGPSSPMMARF